MNETSLQKLEQKALGFPRRASLIEVKDSKTLTTANEFILANKAIQKEIKNTFDPMITKARETHREILAQKKRFIAPLEESEEIVKSLIATYLAEQERMRLEAEARIQREREEAERKAREAEEKRVQLAKEAIEDGNVEEAEQILKEKPVEPDYPIEPIAPPTPTLEEGVSVKEIWKWRVKDEGKIPREYLIMDTVKIGKIVRALKEETNIPGIEAYPEKNISARNV